jgi:hypothetical protein
MPIFVREKMIASHFISALLFVFVGYATSIDVTIKKMLSEDICAEHSGSENTENDTAEKGKEGEEGGVEDENKEFASLQNKPAQALFQAKLNVLAALLKLKDPSVQAECPPPKN